MIVRVNHAEQRVEPVERIGQFFNHFHTASLLASSATLSQVEVSQRARSKGWSVVNPCERMAVFALPGTYVNQSRDTY